MKSSVMKRQRQIRDEVADIQRAVLACIEIARGEEREEEEGLAGLRSDLVLAGVDRDREKTGSDRSGQKTSKHQSSHSSKGNTTTATSSHGGWGRREGGGGWRVTRDVGEGGEATLSYICGLVFNAVTETVARSLFQLSSGLRRGEGGGEREKEESVQNRVIGKLSRSFVDLSGQRTVRFQDSQTVNNPRSVLEELSHSTGSHSVPQLQLEARILLSVPRILMEPRLSEIHALFYQLTSVLLSLLNELSWWAGPGAGREFLVMWDASGAVEVVHSEIFDKFRGWPQILFLFQASKLTILPIIRLYIFTKLENMFQTKFAKLNFLCPFSFLSLSLRPGASGRSGHFVCSSPRLPVERRHARCLPDVPPEPALSHHLLQTHRQTI